MKRTGYFIGIAIMAYGVAALSAPPQSATHPSGETVIVARGTIDATIDLDGYLEPYDTVEFSIIPKAFEGELTILSAAAPGAVKKGQLLLDIDAAPLRRGLESAENELAIADANLAKAQAEKHQGEKADTLAMQIEQNELDAASESLKWWDAKEEKNSIAMANLSETSAKAQVEDQQDELNELKKMYKSDDLTSATADIVVKRAVRALEISRVQAAVLSDRAAHNRRMEIPANRRKLVFALEQEKQKLAQLKIAQEHNRSLRQTAVVSAQAQAEKAKTRVEELRSDLALLHVQSPADGVLYYGQFVQGAWQNSNPRLLRNGEKISARSVVMTLAISGKLRMVVDVPEMKMAWINAGEWSRIVPIALPRATTTGRCHLPSQVAKGSEGNQTYPTLIDLATVDPQLLPGARASARIFVSPAANVLMVPATAVVHGRVKVRSAGGEGIWRDVVVGKSSEEMVEIRTGLAEGERVVRKP